MCFDTDFPVHDEDGLGSMNCCARREGWDAAAHRLLVRPPRRAAILVIALLMACAAAAGAQQPLTPGAGTPQSVPLARQRRRVPPVPPGSVLPSYAGVEGRPHRKVQPVPTAESLHDWSGLEVTSIRFEGVTSADLNPLPAELPQQPGQPLDPVRVRDSLRRLYATGLYRTIAVDGRRTGNSVALTFNGVPTLFLGRILVRGVRNTQLSTQLSYSTRLNPGTVYTQDKIDRAVRLLQQSLQENGYYQGKVTPHTFADLPNAEMNVQMTVHAGDQARVGTVAVKGNSGISLAKFRKKARLKAGSKVNSDTVSRALSNLRKFYQKKSRLEAHVSLASQKYRPKLNRLDYTFQDDRGPLVSISVQGAKLSKGDIRSLVPVYSEGTLDTDLLNEGSRNIRDYFQRMGFFDAKVSFTSSRKAGVAHIQYTVKPGPRDRIVSVGIEGNHYFGSPLIAERLGVQAAGLFRPHGAYSQALQAADVNAITALYQSNGFTDVKVTPEVHQAGTSKGERDLAVLYKIDEGPQQKVGKYAIQGASASQLAAIRPRLSLAPGQPYSGSNLVADRDAILGYFLDHGYDHAEVTVQQKAAAGNRNLIDIAIHVVPGEQIFIRKVLISGLHYTRPSTVKHDILVQPGQPLDQAKLLETQRRLYNLTLFNQVNAAVENPAGDEPSKNVLLQFDEARRWDVDYGAGFQAQTGTPSTNCLTEIQAIQFGITDYSCNPNGKFGVSALVELDISRINLFGRNQSFGFRGEYGTLEQEITSNYSAPHFFNHPTLAMSLSGGYINAQNVITFASSTAEGDLRLTQRADDANTWIYQLSYRRVKVDTSTIQVAPNEIPILSEPVRVGGPEITWIHDTRRPEPLDATAGMYNSVQVFVTDHTILDSEANFAHLDWTNSTYYPLGRRKNFILARNTRFGMERVFGEGKYESIPLPERLYAGGAESLRGFPLNSAGPRDSLTGFPIGGAGVLVNQTELRFPHPELPWFGRTLGFVLFEDMGNVFNNSSDIWPSALRIKQPHSWTCRNLSETYQEQVTRSSSTNPTGHCDFNDFSHTVGVGARYHTPIGPIRLDFGYNLNPPIYPVIVTYGTNSNGQTQAPYVGQAGHFNFFFSIGQAF